MFKKGQVWRGIRNKSHVIIVERVNDAQSMVNVKFIDGPRTGQKGWDYAGTVEAECALIGNNYQERRATKAEKPAIDKETHNLITKLRASNHRLRQMNCDLRDDIRDMASKLHLVYRDKFPGIAALWPAPEALPEQRGCRKEDC